MKKLTSDVVLALVTLMAVLPAGAAEEGVASGGNGMMALAGALAIAVAAFGGAIGQAKAACAALEGIARNPAAQGKIFVPMIIALALIESLVIYALIIAFQLVGKV